MEWKTSRLRSLCLRLRLRFSLRTLLAFTLLTAGLFNLAWHCAPWQEQWRVRTKASRLQFLPDGSGVFALYAPEEGRTEKPNLCVWELATGKQVLSQQITLPPQERVSYAWSSADARHLFVMAHEPQANAYYSPEEGPKPERRRVYACDVQNPSVSRFELPDSFYLDRSPDGTQLILSTTQEILLLDLRSASILARTSLEGSHLGSCAWSAEGTWVALKFWRSSGERDDYFIWVLEGCTLRELSRITLEPPTGFGRLYPLDEQRLLVSCAPTSHISEEVRLRPLRSFVFDIRSGALLSTVPGFVNSVRPFQGRALAVLFDDVGCYRYDLDAQLILNQVECRTSAPWFNDMKIGRYFSPDGQRIIQDGFLQFGTSSGPCESAVYDSATGKMLFDLGNSYPTVSTDYRWITDNDGGVVRSTRSGAEVYRIPKDSRVAFAPNGERLLAIDEERFTLFERRRPEEWWGVVWLHEFWLVVLLGGVLGWSCVLDRRSFRLDERSKNLSQPQS
jgi:hypothetical protein